MRKMNEILLRPRRIGSAATVSPPAFVSGKFLDPYVDLKRRGIF
jgi:hypothetical protein